MSIKKKSYSSGTYVTIQMKVVILYIGIILLKDNKISKNKLKNE